MANNYGQSASQLPDQHPHLSLLIDRFVNYNDSQIKLISSIEDRLNSILNKRSPEKISSGVDKKMDTDFVQSMITQMDRLSSQNDMLERLLSHLSEII